MPSSFFRVSPSVVPILVRNSSPDKTVTGLADFDVYCFMPVLVISTSSNLYMSLSLVSTKSRFRTSERSLGVLSLSGEFDLLFFIKF